MKGQLSFMNDQMQEYFKYVITHKTKGLDSRFWEAYGQIKF